MADPRIIAVDLDDATVAWRSDDLAQERRMALADLVGSRFQPCRPAVDGYAGPYRVGLSVIDGRLVLCVARADGSPIETLVLALGRFRRPIRDYFALCDSHEQASAAATAQQIETIDMARRALHNDGAELLRERFAGKIDVDFDTARRLFTLLCALHRKA